jgi:pyruvate dehydrogenase E1 component
MRWANWSATMIGRSDHRQRSGGMLERRDSTLALDNPILANDSDPAETAEWLDALESVFRMVGGERAEFILSALGRKAKDLGVVPDVLPFGPYRNTIPLEKQGPYPGDLDTETRITAIIRWNALAMVMRANASYGELGGHVASYASAAEIFEIGFNISSAGWRANTPAMSSSSNLTQPLASTLELSSKAASPRIG